MTELSLCELQGDHAIAELFHAEKGSTLSVNYHFINEVEKRTFLNSELSIGMTTDNDEIIIYWEFQGDIINLITPFDVRLYENEKALNTKNDKVTMELIDNALNTTIATREITLPKEFMSEVVSAIEVQLSKDKEGTHDLKWELMRIPELKKLIPKFHSVS